MAEEEEAAMEDPWIAALEESWNQMSKARDFLKTQTCKEAAVVINALFKSQESSEYKSARAVYECCVANFADFLTLKLLKTYQSCRSSSLLRFRTIYLLSEAITEFRNRNFQFSLPLLRDAKPLLISCLEMKETGESEIKILRRIVSFVAYNVGMLDDGGWEELSGCILQLADTYPRCRGFHVFLDVPALCDNFINLQVMERLLDEAERVLLKPDKVRVQDWVLAVETAIKIVVHVVDSEMESSLLIERVRSSVMKSAKDVVKKGKGEFVDRGLEDLKMFLARDGTLCKYNKHQRTFVTDLVFKIASCRHKSNKERKKVKSEISRVLRKPNTYADDDDDHISGFEVDWCNHLATLSSLEILGVFAETNLEERSRELAIRRLNLLLSNHTTKKVVIDISVMRQLQPLLISCLEEDRLSVSDSIFKVLGEVVFHVANEVLSKQEEETWFNLWDYIVSQCKTQFEKAVYIFQSLTMKLDDLDILIPVIDILLPEINTRLNPPVRLLVDNSCWVLAFVGAFSAAIHLVEVTSHADSVKEITNKMIGSVRELVERGGMEVGVVRRAFRDLEKVVKKQVKWYSTSNYVFVKGLLSRLSAIKAMKMESRMALWRINAILKRGVHDDLKETNPKSELDWLSKPEEA